uniref:Uncharacterized protein n=2 Tax=Arundo donax TaxID=35708 RepID=A0A0A9G631_ARUDO
MSCSAQSRKVSSDASVRQFDSTSSLKICWLRSLGNIMNLEYLSISLQTLDTQSSMRDGHLPGPFACPLRETSELLRGSESSSHFKLLVFDSLVDVWKASPSSTNWLLFLEQTPPMIEVQVLNKNQSLLLVSMISVLKTLVAARPLFYHPIMA